MYTILSPDAHATTLTLPDGSRHHIVLGTDALCRLLQPLPPTDAQWERAIMAVEDAIAPMRKLLPAHSTLRLTHADALLPIASDGLLHQSAVEQLFQRVSRYGSDPALPQTAAAYAQLLLVREWLHHMGFEHATLMPNGAAS